MWPTLKRRPSEKTPGKEQLKVRSTPATTARTILCGPPKLKKIKTPIAANRMGPKTKTGRPGSSKTSTAKLEVRIPYTDSVLSKQTLEADQALAAVRDRLRKQNERIWAVVAELEAEERRRETQLQQAVQDAESSLCRLRDLALPTMDDAN